MQRLKVEVEHRDDSGLGDEMYHSRKSQDLAQASVHY